MSNPYFPRVAINFPNPRVFRFHISLSYFRSPFTRSTGTQTGSRWRGRPSEPSTSRPRTYPAAPQGPPGTRPHPRPHLAAPPHASAPLHPACPLLKPKRRAGSLTHLLLKLFVPLLHTNSLANCTNIHSYFVAHSPTHSLDTQSVLVHSHLRLALLFFYLDNAR